MAQTQPATEKRKYRISEALAKFPAEVQTAKREEIRLACGGMNKSTLSQICNIKKGDKRMVPFDWAIEICRILGIKPFEFINT